MSDTPHSPGSDRHRIDRMHDLFADQALEGLSAVEAAELADLLREHPSASAQVTLDELDRAAATAHLAMLHPVASLPESLQSKLQAAAAEWSARQARPVSPASQQRIDLMHPSVASESLPFPSPRRSGSAWGWLAAAACLAIAVAGWWPRLSGPVSPVDQRTQLIAAAPADLIQWNWTATEDPAAKGASGDVVWSNSRQEGYMRFRGLGVNDPKLTAYQLWIFDKNRPDTTPVDGGVFDIEQANGDVIVPIRAKIKVFDPAMFAITVEQPGGVVVSKRERIPVLAKPAERAKT